MSIVIATKYKELIDIYIDENNIEYISMRDLHRKIESKKDFTSWCKSKIKKLGLKEIIDYKIFNCINGDKVLLDYYFTKKATLYTICTLKNLENIERVFEFLKADELEDIQSSKNIPCKDINQYKKEFISTLENLLRYSTCKIIKEHFVFKAVVSYIPAHNIAFVIDEKEKSEYILGCRLITLDVNKSIIDNINIILDCMNEPKKSYAPVINGIAYSIKSAATTLSKKIGETISEETLLCLLEEGDMLEKRNGKYAPTRNYQNRGWFIFKASDNYTNLHITDKGIDEISLLYKNGSLIEQTNFLN